MSSPLSVSPCPCKPSADASSSAAAPKKVTCPTTIMETQKKTLLEVIEHLRSQNSMFGGFEPLPPIRTLVDANGISRVVPQVAVKDIAKGLHKLYQAKNLTEDKGVVCHKTIPQRNIINHINSLAEMVQAQCKLELRGKVDGTPDSAVDVAKQQFVTLAEQVKDDVDTDTVRWVFSHVARKDSEIDDVKKCFSACVLSGNVAGVFDRVVIVKNKVFDKDTESEQRTAQDNVVRLLNEHMIGYLNTYAWPEVQS